MLDKYISSKKFIILLFVLIISGILLFLYILSSEQKEPLPELQEPLQKTTSLSRISTNVVTPGQQSWHGGDIIAEIRDSISEGEFATFVPGRRGCEYIVEDISTGKTARGIRECGVVEVTVPVGVNGICTTSYTPGDFSKGKCMLTSIALDSDGNTSRFTGKIFNIDIERPSVEIIDSPEVVLPNEEFLIQARVSDNRGIAECWLFADTSVVETEQSISPLPCNDNQSCILSMRGSFDSPGDKVLAIACRDTLGNAASSASTQVLVYRNYTPKISSCSVTPAEGNSDTIFAFSAVASDQNNDILRYKWDFGDGKFAFENTVTHQYLSKGVYRPSVSVQDAQGESVLCSTAWTVIKE